MLDAETEYVRTLVRAEADKWARKTRRTYVTPIQKQERDERIVARIERTVRRRGD